MRRKRNVGIVGQLGCHYCLQRSGLLLGIFSIIACAHTTAISCFIKSGNNQLDLLSFLLLSCWRENTTIKLPLLSLGLCHCVYESLLWQHGNEVPIDIFHDNSSALSILCLSHRFLVTEMYSVLSVCRDQRVIHN